MRALPCAVGAHRRTLGCRIPTNAPNLTQVGAFVRREVNVKTMPVPPTAGRATCSDPEHLPLVDAAFEKPGGPEAQEMKRTLCRHCPVQAMCATWAMTHREAGVWGGTAPKWRTQNGGPSIATQPSPQPPVPRQRLRSPSKADLLMAELGTRRGIVRAWAYEQGLVDSLSGCPSLAVVEAWAAAHQDA